jgi:hypothetical protein
MEEVMAISSEAFQDGDVYIDFPFARVMFHWEKRGGTSGVLWRRFYGGHVNAASAQSNLFRDAQRHGIQITAGQFAAGKVAIK